MAESKQPKHSRFFSRLKPGKSSKEIAAEPAQPVRGDPQADATKSDNKNQQSISQVLPSQKTGTGTVENSELAPQNDTDIDLSDDPTQLWDKAYDELKEEEPKLVQAYELILTQNAADSESAGQIALDWVDRSRDRVNMEQLLNAGLEKISRLGKFEKSLSFAINIVLSVKSTVSTALVAAPVAAVPWTAICLALQVVVDPIDRRAVQRDGVSKVVEKMKWYSSLSTLLLERSFKDDPNYEELRNRLSAHVVQLYKAIIRYIIKSICAQYRNQMSQFFREGINWDDWKGSLDEIDRAEKLVQERTTAYLGQQTKSYLALLVNIQMTEKQSDILKSLSVRDMYMEMKYIEARKEKLLDDSYRWVLDHQSFKDFIDWRDENDQRLLWIKGDRGMGKTMLMMGLVRELTRQQETHFDSPYLSFFFCQGTDNEVNSATAILKGLIRMLVRQERSLFQHVEKMFDDFWRGKFDSRTAFFSLKDLFMSITQDPNIKRAILVIDALDECQQERPGLDDLLGLINDTIENNNRIKWLISSRDNPTINEYLVPRETKCRQFLELNSETISGAVDAYINVKINGLRERYMTDSRVKFNERAIVELESILEVARVELHNRADSTFLWVALIFDEDDMRKISARKLVEHIQKLPKDLDAIYSQMLHNIQNANDPVASKKALCIMFNAFRPLLLSELMVLAEIDELDLPEQCVRQSGFITIRGDTVFFLHQSAKDYLLTNAEPGMTATFPDDVLNVHRAIVERSLDAMLRTLKKDIYDIRHPGASIAEIRPPEPNPLKSIGYSCQFWIEHICESNSYGDDEELCDGASIDLFLRKHFLQWLEALSLLGAFAYGTQCLSKLVNLISGISPDSQLIDLLKDMRRFVWFNRDGIISSPLQLFKNDEPQWIMVKPAVEDEWDACLQTISIDYRSDRINFVANGQRLITERQRFKFVQIWDWDTGVPLQTIKSLGPIAFCSDDRQLASISEDNTIVIWDLSSGVPLKTLRGLSQSSANLIASSIVFSSPCHLASGSRDEHFVRLWDLDKGICIRTLHGHKEGIASVATAARCQRLASGSSDLTARVWELTSGVCLGEFPHKDPVVSVRLSPNGNGLVSKTQRGTINVWNVDTANCLKTYESNEYFSEIYSHDSKRFAIKCNGFMEIWDLDRRTCVRAQTDLSDDAPRSFSPNNELLASAASATPGGLTVWNTSTGESMRRFEGGDHYLFRGLTIVFSPDSQRMAAALSWGIRIWNVTSGDLTHTFRGSFNLLMSMTFSPDGQLLASQSFPTLQIWDASKLHTEVDLRFPLKEVTWVTLSSDGAWLAALSGATVYVWNTDLSLCVYSLADVRTYSTPKFSRNNQYLGIASSQTLKLWDPQSGALIQELKAQFDEEINNFVFSPNHQRVAATDGQIIQIWSLEDGQFAETVFVKRKERGKELVFSPSSETFAVYSRLWKHSIIEIRDVETGDHLQQFSISDSYEIKSLGFSSDGERLVVVPWFNRVRILEIKTGKTLWSSKFDDDFEVSVDRVAALSSSPSQIKRSNIQAERWDVYGLIELNQWITWKGQKIVWLPSKYRPSYMDAWDANNKRMVFGCESGEVFFITVSPSFNYDMRAFGDG